ncbi:hypothetical protein HY477_01860, partial [Candidatus Uhrbacteria bacterium]|nr:hypothetical protein [Candidatus Uhrbacteria bacterium]
MWRQVKTPSYITERIESFSLPVEDRVLVFDPDNILYVVDIVSPYNVAEQTGQDAEATINQYRAIFSKPCSSGSSGEHEVSQHRGNICKHELRVQFQNRWYPILGLMGGKPLMTNDRGETLTLTLAKGMGNYNDSNFTVAKEGKEIFKYNFKDFSGDWTYVTFTKDNEYILLGNPYEF